MFWSPNCQLVVRYCVVSTWTPVSAGAGTGGKRSPLALFYIIIQRQPSGQPTGFFWHAKTGTIRSNRESYRRVERAGENNQAFLAKLPQELKKSGTTPELKESPVHMSLFFFAFPPHLKKTQLRLQIKKATVWGGLRAHFCTKQENTVIPVVCVRRLNEKRSADLEHAERFDIERQDPQGRGYNKSFVPLSCAL